jgi:hypothetical protein
LHAIDHLPSGNDHPQRLDEAHETVFVVQVEVSGAGSSIEDAQAADEMFRKTKGRCRTFIQDPETMLDLHDKDRFMSLVESLGSSAAWASSIDDPAPETGMKRVAECFWAMSSRAACIPSW